MENLEVVSQKSFNDHDLLLVLHRDVQHITDTLKELKDTDIREIKENTAARLQKIEDNYTTKAEVRQIVGELEKETIKVLDDHETRIRATERYMWARVGAAGAIGGIIAFLGYFIASGLFNHHL